MLCVKHHDHDLSGDIFSLFLPLRLCLRIKCNFLNISNEKKKYLQEHFIGIKVTGRAIIGHTIIYARLHYVHVDVPTQWVNRRNSVIYISVKDFIIITSVLPNIKLNRSLWVDYNWRNRWRHVCVKSNQIKINLTLHN